MADVQRTLTLLLANHVSGTPAPAQAIRDLLVSVFGGYASLYLADGAVVQILGTTPLKLTGFASAGPFSDANPDAALDNITITTAGAYLVSFDATCSGDAATYAFRLRKNDVAEGSLVCGVTLVGGADQKHTSFAGLILLAASDVLTIWGEADQAAKNLTPKHMQLAIKRVS